MWRDLGKALEHAWEKTQSRKDVGIPRDVKLED